MRVCLITARGKIGRMQDRADRRVHVGASEVRDGRRSLKPNLARRFDFHQFVQGFSISGFLGVPGGGAVGGELFAMVMAATGFAAAQQPYRESQHTAAPRGNYGRSWPPPHSSVRYSERWYADHGNATPLPFPVPRCRLIPRGRLRSPCPKGRASFVDGGGRGRGLPKKSVRRP